MKQNLSVVFAFIALIIAGLALFQQQKSKAALEALKNKHQDLQDSVPAKAEHEELAEYMMRLQWYANKLYFSGSAGNSALVEFYVHEMKEVMEEVEAAAIIDEGINISELMETYGEDQIKRFDDSIEKEGFANFNEHYTALIASCNSCHVVAEHAFIKIEIPQIPVADNQVFTP